MIKSVTRTLYIDGKPIAEYTQDPMADSELADMEHLSPSILAHLKQNPDYFFRGRFLDGKSMKEEPGERRLAKRNIQNRLRDAFLQADDAFLEIPKSYPISWIDGAINGKLNSSTHYHIVYVKYGDELLFYESKKKPTS